VSQRLLSSLGLLCLVPAAALAGGFDLRETQDAVVVATSAYELSLSRTGAAATLTRGGATVLDGWAASGPGGVFEKGGTSQTIGVLARVSREGDQVTLDYTTSVKDSLARLELRPMADAVRITVRLLVSEADMVPGFAWTLASAGHWYGGGFQGFRDPQVWPLEEASIVRPTFLVSGLSQATPFWYTTKGVGVFVRTPLDFRYSVNAPADGKKDGLLRIAMPLASALEYDLVVTASLREAVQRFLREVGHPRRVPPAEYFRLPIYTTWVEHKADVTQAKVVELARAIRSNALPAGVVEIDDRWEAHYGDMDFDGAKFPDPRAMNDELHRMGFRVTLWVHPFVNPDARTFAEHARERLLIRDANDGPALIRWWNGPAAVRDFSNPRAAEAFRRQLDGLMRRFGFDGFKFDGGDVHFVAKDARLARAVTAAEFPDVYNAEATAQYGWNETRVGILSQPLGIVQRLIDKNSVWGRENGLGALVPEALTTSLRGFFFLMPDMVGGNQYDGDQIDAELLVRWAQASALMPLLQFSVGPWHHGPEAVRLCRAASQLHLDYAPYTYRLAEASTSTGEPILAPLAYQFPDDPETFRITDQFMLGPDVLVAPVVEKDAVARDLYLPKGRWIDQKTKKPVEGGRWLRAYPAPLDTLPLFVRAGARVL
jgi:alpha-glucosidase (family GH31 glycosyl hydrolase)